MKLKFFFKTMAAIAGLAGGTFAAHAQLNVNVREQASFGSFVGGVNNAVTNSGSINTVEVVTTGNPVFDITYTPVFGPAGPIPLTTGTLNVATLTWHSGTNPASTFSSANFNLRLDFDNNGIFEVDDTFTLTLSPFSAGGFTGFNYAIVPINVAGNALINGTLYSYAGVWANANGGLFDGSTTTSTLQFQFDTPRIVPVPEPSTYGMLGALGLAGLLAVRRVRHQSAALAK